MEDEKDPAEELKPCPFCGGALRVGTDESRDIINSVYCEKCSTEMTVLWHTRPSNYRRHFNARWVDTHELEDAERKAFEAGRATVLGGYDFKDFESYQQSKKESRR